jgi:hypothetical protein
MVIQPEVHCLFYIRNAANSEENLYTLGRIFYLSLLSTGQKAGNALQQGFKVISPKVLPSDGFGVFWCSIFDFLSCT